MKSCVITPQLSEELKFSAVIRDSTLQASEPIMSNSVSAGVHINPLGIAQHPRVSSQQADEDQAASSTALQAASCDDLQNSAEVTSTALQSLEQLVTDGHASRIVPCTPIIQTNMDRETASDGEEHCVNPLTSNPGSMSRVDNEVTASKSCPKSVNSTASSNSNPASSQLVAQYSLEHVAGHPASVENEDIFLIPDSTVLIDLTIEDIETGSTASVESTTSEHMISSPDAPENEIAPSRKSQSTFRLRVRAVEDINKAILVLDQKCDVGCSVSSTKLCTGSTNSSKLDDSSRGCSNDEVITSQQALNKSIVPKTAVGSANTELDVPTNHGNHPSSSENQELCSDGNTYELMSSPPAEGAFNVLGCNQEKGDPQGKQPDGCQSTKGLHASKPPLRDSHDALDINPPLSGDMNLTPQLHESLPAPNIKTEPEDDGYETWNQTVDTTMLEDFVESIKEEPDSPCGGILLKNCRISIEKIPSNLLPPPSANSCARNESAQKKRRSLLKPKISAKAQKLQTNANCRTSPSTPDPPLNNYRVSSERLRSLSVNTRRELKKCAIVLERLSAHDILHQEFGLKPCQVVIERLSEREIRNHQYGLKNCQIILKKLSEHEIKRYQTHPPLKDCKVSLKKIALQSVKNTAVCDASTRPWSQVKVYSCSQCKYFTTSEELFKKHVVVHAQPKSQLCPSCGLISSDPEEIANHNCTQHDITGRCRFCELKLSKENMKTHLASKHAAFVKCVIEGNSNMPFSCYHCCYTTPDKKDLETHIMIHVGQKPMRKNVIIDGRKYMLCTLCNFKTWRKGDMDRHMNQTRKHGKPQYACNWCKFRAFRKTHIRKHMERHLRNKMISCSVCGTQFVDKEGLERHMATVHQSSRVKNHSCTLCGFKAYNACYVKIHMMNRHSTFRPFACPECNYRAKSQSLLDIHRPIHSTKKEFACSLCDYRSHRSSIVKSHERSLHSDLRPLPCPYCDFRAKTHGSLRTHIMIHNDDKAFKCSDCDHRALSATLLKSHRLKHTKEKPYSCLHCEYRSSRSWLIKIHTDKYHEGLPYKKARY